MQIDNTVPLIDEKLILDLITDQDLERLDRALGTSTIFELVGLHNSEIRHSYFLKNLLDPTSPLRLGDVFIRHFLRQVLTTAEQLSDESIGLLELELAEFSDCTVYREYKNIDLLIEIKTSTKSFCICVENKVDASESKTQLPRYRGIVNKDFPNHKKLFLFLTPEGDPAENDNGWISADYAMVVNSLDHVLKTALLNGDQTLLLNHYKKHLEKNVIGDKELQDLANQLYKRHRVALDFIFENKEDQTSELSRRLQDWIKSSGNALGIIPAVSSKTFVRFSTPLMREISQKYPGDAWRGANGIAETIVGEIQLRPNQVRIFYVLGPTVELEHRYKLLEKLVPNEVNKQMGKKWTTIKSEKLLSEKQLAEDDLDKIFEELTRKIETWINGEGSQLSTKLDELLQA